MFYVLCCLLQCRAFIIDIVMYQALGMKAFFLCVILKRIYLIILSECLNDIRFFRHPHCN